MAYLERLEEFDKIYGTHCITQSLMEVMFNTTNLFSKKVFNESIFFGLDASIDFVFRDLGKEYIPHIFIGGRRTTWLDIFPFVTGIKIVRNIVKDNKVAWEKLKYSLDRKIPVILEVDKYQIDYWRKTIGPEDYGGHLIVAVAYDQEGVYVSDQCRSNDKFMKISYYELEQARSNELYWKSPQNSYYTFELPDKLLDNTEMLMRAIQINSRNMINGSIVDAKNGLMAYEAFMENLEKWEDMLNYDIKSPKTGKTICALDYELFKIKKLVHEGNIGGGGNFRYLYASFLENAARMADIKRLIKESAKFKKSADKWKEISKIIAASESDEFVHKNKMNVLRNIYLCVKEVYKIENEAFYDLYDMFNGM